MTTKNPFSGMNPFFEKRWREAPQTGFQYGAIQYTEPFLNHQHIAEPTLFSLERLARRTKHRGLRAWRDLEDHVLISK